MQPTAPICNSGPTQGLCGAEAAASGDCTLSQGSIGLSGGSEQPLGFVVQIIRWANGACTGGEHTGRVEELGGEKQAQAWGGTDLVSSHL